MLKFPNGETVTAQAEEQVRILISDISSIIEGGNRMQGYE